MSSTTTIKPAHLKLLTDLCNTPTAPYREEQVIAWVLAWARRRRRHIKVTRDPAGNVHLHYRRGRATGPLLVIEAHLDHPGFVATGCDKQGRLTALFRGGVRPSHFKKARAAFWVPAPSATAVPAKTARRAASATNRGHWVRTAVLETKPGGPHGALQVLLKKPPEAIAPGTLGMWDLPDARVRGKLFAARVCDDLAGAAAALCLLEELIARRRPAHVRVLLTRAEEVGFAGVLAVAQNGWIPRRARIIGLETSRGSATAPQGAGPVVRVGDRTGTFASGLTHFVAQAAGSIADREASFKYQRKLMDGGTCNSTAFCAFGYEATGLCLALGNYHNMTIPGEIGWKDAPTAGPGIAAETIHLDDFAGLVRILVAAVARLKHYQPDAGAIRTRLATLHKTQQVALLYGTSDQPAARRYLRRSRGR